MKNLNQRALLSAPIAVPGIDEQAEVVEAIERAFERIKQLGLWCETELARSTSLRQSILKDAFAGRLVPQDPDDEPASELLARINKAREDTHQKTRRRAKA